MDRSRFLDPGSGQTDPGSWILLDRVHVKWRSEFTVQVHRARVFHKWDGGGTPFQTMQLQEMGVDGQDSREIGGSTTDHIFLLKYPMSFLQNWYTTYPPPHQHTTTTGSSVVSPSSVGVDTDMSGKHLGSHWLQLPTHTPEEGCCLQSLYSGIQWPLSQRNHGQVLWDDFFNRTEDSDTDVWTRLRRSWVQSLIY